MVYTHEPSSEFVSAAKLRAFESVQPAKRGTQPSERVARESKLSAVGSAQPRTWYWHEPSSRLAEAAKLEARESVQPPNA